MKKEVSLPHPVGTKASSSALKNMCKTLPAPCVFFYPEYGGDKFFWNDGWLSKHYKALYLGWPKSSENKLSIWTKCQNFLRIINHKKAFDPLCGRNSYTSRGPGLINGATKHFEKQWVWNGVHSALWLQLRSYLEEIVSGGLENLDYGRRDQLCLPHDTRYPQKNWH
jgi:hypothetical protein